ncbi:MAG TPA: dTDP-4-dehydrorhamnose reductase [Burkholderiales bacterium]|jgi:dTDP-4-dehydrorhamnose reductase
MQRILVPGRNGQVGWELQSALAPLGTVVGLDIDQMDLADPDSIRRVVRDARPEIIVNAAAYTAVDKAESEPELAMRVNGVAPGILAEEAKRLSALLLHYSTDYVFDGELGRPYREDDAPNPVNAYGESKLAGERAIEAVGGQYLILRTSWVYSARGSNFVLTVLRLAREKPELAMVNDQSGSPTWARWLAHATAELLRKRDVVAHRGGIYHLAATGHATRYDFATAIIDTMKQVSGDSRGWAKLKPISTDQYPLPARRPPRPVMRMDKIAQAFGVTPPHWQEQLHGFLEELAKRPRLGV